MLLNCLLLAELIEAVLQIIKADKNFFFKQGLII